MFLPFVTRVHTLNDGSSKNAGTVLIGRPVDLKLYFSVYRSQGLPWSTIICHPDLSLPPPPPTSPLGYSEFCLIHRLGLLLGFRFLDFTILCVCVWGGGGGGGVGVAFFWVIAIDLI